MFEKPPKRNQTGSRLDDSPAGIDMPLHHRSGELNALQRKVSIIHDVEVVIENKVEDIKAEIAKMQKEQEEKERMQVEMSEKIQ